MSGLSRTPGKRVWVNSPPRVRIPPAPPVTSMFSSILTIIRPAFDFELRVFCCSQWSFSGRLRRIGRYRLG